FLPWANERVAEHRPFHQPETERKDSFTAGPGWELGIHDHEPPAAAKPVPGMLEDFPVMGDSVVGETEQHCIKRCRRGVCDGVALNERNVFPIVSLAQPFCPTEHPRREVNAVDAAGGPNCAAQEWEIATGAAADFQHAFAVLEPKPFDSFFAELGGLKEQPI